MKAKPISKADQASDLDESELKTLDRLIRRPSQTPFIHVQQAPPSCYRVTPAALANIGRAIFHTDRIPADWARKCNEMDEIWVPSRFNQESFRASGVNPEKIHIIPAPVEVHRFGETVEPLPLPNRRGFNFFSVFSPTLREGWDVLLRAYVEAFQRAEDVCLYLKLLGSSEALRQQGADQLQSHLRNALGLDPDTIPDIVVITEDIPADAVPALYSAVDAFVLPSRAEGWGHAHAQAMASGLPVIGTGWGGNTDYMNHENAYLIEYTLVNVPEAAALEEVLFQGHRWAEPSYSHLRTLLRDVFENRGEAKQKGQRARESMAKKFSPETVAKQIQERIHSLLSERAEETLSESVHGKKACAGHRP